jgi:hypothetical protein
MPKAFFIFVGPVLNVGGDLKKPDLVIKNQDR